MYVRVCEREREREREREQGTFLFILDLIYNLTGLNLVYSFS